MKTCTKCGVEKTLDSFNKRKIAKDGLQYTCKACKKAYYEAWYEENSEKAAANSKAYYQENIEALKDQMKAYSKVYRAKNKEEIAAWSKENPEKCRQYSRKRRAMKELVNENYKKEDEAYTLRLFDHACFNCGCTENLAIDHYRPLSKGNPLTRTNAIILCKSCNSSKGSKDPEQFFSEEQTTIIQEVFGRVEEQV